MGQRKNLSPRQESNPWPPEHRARVYNVHIVQIKGRLVETPTENANFVPGKAVSNHLNAFDVTLYLCQLKLTITYALLQQALIKSFFSAYLQCFRSVVMYYAGVMAGGKFARGVAGGKRRGNFLQLYEYFLGCPDVFTGRFKGRKGFWEPYTLPLVVPRLLQHARRYLLQEDRKEVKGRNQEPIMGSWRNICWHTKVFRIAQKFKLSTSP